MSAQLAILALFAAASSSQGYSEIVIGNSKAYGITNADYNADGHPDIFVNGHDFDDAIQFWSPSGYIQGGVFLRSDRHECDTSDVDLDGHLDLFCAVGADRGTGTGVNEMWMAQGNATFLIDHNSGAEDIYGRGRIPRFFNFDGDGIPDLFLGNYGVPRTDGRVNINHVYRGQRNGKFVEKQTAATEASYSYCVTKGDVNNDGYDDIAVCDRSAVNGKIWINNKMGDFTLMSTPATAPWRTARFSDINQDGWDDLIVLTWSNQLRIHLNAKGSGRFPSISYRWVAPNGVVPMDFAIGDFDRNGKRDIYLALKSRNCTISTTPGNDTIDDIVFLGDGSGNVFAPITLQQNLAGCAYLVQALTTDQIVLSQAEDGVPAQHYLITPF